MDHLAYVGRVFRVTAVSWDVVILGVVIKSDRVCLTFLYTDDGRADSDWEIDHLTAWQRDSTFRWVV